MALTVAQIDDAIAVVLKHQKYTLLDRMYEFADLGKLRTLRKEIQSEEHAVNNRQWNVVRRQAVSI